MACRYEIRPELRIVITRFSDRVDGDGVLACYHGVYGDAQYDVGFDEIVDLRDVPFGIGRMYEAAASEGSEEVRVFRSSDEAARWLRPERHSAVLALLEG